MNEDAAKAESESSAAAAAAAEAAAKQNDAGDEESKKREAFGNRHLKEGDDVFKFNAWDNVEWDDEQTQMAKEKIDRNSRTPTEQELANKLLEEANENWNKFYSIHENKFFKDRNWLFTEFPELLGHNRQTEGNQDERFSILEVGCGVGNTIFPVLRSNTSPNLFVYACDFSSTAIDILRSTSDYDEKRCKAFVCDITNLDDNKDFPIKENELDIIVMIFVLSAIKPEKFVSSIKSLVKYLKPDGKLLFRDYGLYDMAQLRFKDGHCLEKNFYHRGDGTFVYFFSQEEIDSMFVECGLKKEFNIIDKRLQINRGKQLKMFRVWIQAKYIKTHATASATTTK